MPRRTDTPRRVDELGKALVEITISAAILSVVLLSALSSFGTTLDVQSDLLSRDVLEENVRKTTQRIVHLLREARLDTLAEVPEAPLVSTSIVFQRITPDTLTGSVPEVEPEIEPEIEPSPEEQTPTPPDLQLVDGEERILFTDGRLDLESTDDLSSLGRNLSLVTFSLEGRAVLVTLRAEGRGSHGETIHVSRRTHVTLQN